MIIVLGKFLAWKERLQWLESSERLKIRLKNAFQPAGRPAGVMKRPSNMKRELYNILVTQQREGKDISSMMPSNVHDMYKNPKANVGILLLIFGFANRQELLG